MNVVLISTYDLGHQPFGLSSPAAWLRERGHHVTCVDLAISTLPSLLIRESAAVAFFLPMHTATRLAADAIGKVRLLNPSAHLLAYGLYAPVNAAYLRELGVQTIAGGEFERALAEALDGQPSTELISLERLPFRVPDRTGLPDLALYSKLRVNGSGRVAGYTEASRGCKHLCRHCPIVPVYKGIFRVVQPEIVVEDVCRQVAAGAEHITFGDPDFLNGPTHAMRIVRRIHDQFPGLTYDVTIKVEHLLKHSSLLEELRDTGCLFVTSAVESVDDHVLAKFDKGHTCSDFQKVCELFRQVGLVLAPTFVPFTPWTTLAAYRQLLRTIAAENLIENVAPIQLALRLLIPPGSLLLELEDVRDCLSGYDKAALLHRWKHSDPEVDTLANRLLRLVSIEQKRRRSRRDIFALIWEEAHGAPPREEFDLIPRAAIPYMDEPWYC